MTKSNVDILETNYNEALKSAKFYESEYEALKYKYEELEEKLKQEKPAKSWANTEVPADIFGSAVEVVSKSPYPDTEEMTAYNYNLISHLIKAVRYMTMTNGELKGIIEGLNERIEGLTEVKHQNKLAEAITILSELEFDIEMVHRRRGK